MRTTPHRGKSQVRQLSLPGVMPALQVEVARPASLSVGQGVVYTGRVAGGPPQGIWGRVQRLTLRGAWVHFGPAGSWLVPHHLLGIPLRADRPQGSENEQGV